MPVSFYLIQSEPPPEPFSSHSYGESNRLERSWDQGFHGMGERNGDDSLGFGLLDTVQNIFFAQSRVDQDRNRSGFKQSERQRYKIDPIRNHHEYPVSFFKAVVEKAGGN